MPITINDASEIAGLNIKLHFDGKVLTALGAEKADLTSGFTLADSVAPGMISIAASNAAGIPSGSGALVNVRFRVNSTVAPGDSTLITFEKAELWDDKGPHQILALHENNKFTVARGQRGDVNLDGAISVPDAIICLRIVAGLPLPPLPPGHLQATAYEEWSADMNENDDIDADDAYLILLKALGRTALGKFVTTSGKAEASIKLETFIAQAGEIITVPVVVQNDVKPCAASMILSYDAQKLSVVEVRSGVDSALMAANTQERGKIRLALINPDGITGPQGAIVVIMVKLEQGGEIAAPLKFEQLNLLDVQANRIDARTSVDETVALPTTFGLEQNYPNPFNPETSIAYQLPKDALVSLQVYNLTGQVVATLVNGKKPAGHHSALWNGRDEAGRQLPSGVYFYRLLVNQGEWAQVKKMTLLK